MQALRAVVNNTVISFIGQLITWTSTLLLTAAYGRFLGDVKFGELFLAVSLVAVVGFPIEFGFNQQLVRDVARRPERAPSWATNALVIKLGLWAILYGLLIALSWMLGYSVEERILVAICGGTLLSTSLGNTFGAMHMAAHRMVYPTGGAVIEKGLDAVVLIVLLSHGAGVRVAAVVLLAGSLASAIWQAAWFVRLVGMHLTIDLALIRSLIRTSVPFLVYGVLGVIYYRLDAILLQSMTTTAVVGWYGAGYRIFDTLVFLPNIVMMAVMYPLMARLSVSSEANLKIAIEKSANFLVFCGLPIATGMIVAAPNIVALLYHRAEFAPTAGVLRGLAPGILLLYMNAVWTTALMTVKLERKLPIMAGVALVFNLVCNLLLIPRLLGVGAAITTTLTEGLLFSFSIAWLPRHLLPVNSLRVAAKALAASLVMALVVLALLDHFSLVLVVPTAALVYVLVATLLGTIPRADVEAVVLAVSEKIGGGRPAPHAQPADVALMQRGAAAQAGGPVSLHPRLWFRALSRVGIASAVRSFAMPDALGILWWVRRLPRQRVSQVRRWTAASVKYLTNHLIAHVPIYAVRRGWYRHVLGWYIGPGASILLGQHIQMAGIRTSGKRVSIGADTVINHGCMLYSTGGLLIGEHVSISPGVWLVTGSHVMDDPGFPAIYRPITIDDYAWIGARATILGGVTIGRGAVVMAGAVVTRDVEPFAVAGGVPARVVSRRQLRSPAYELNFHPLFE